MGAVSRLAVEHCGLGEPQKGLVIRVWGFGLIRVWGAGFRVFTWLGGKMNLQMALEVVLLVLVKGWTIGT